MTSLWRRLIFAFAILVIILLAGVTGYMVIEGWSFFDAFYMTVISLTTVGYGEIHDLSTNGRMFTIILLFSGMGVLAYGIGTFTAFLVEGHLMNFLRGRKMQSRIEKLKSHYILCGYQGEGRYVLEELIKTKTPHVVVAKDASGLESLFPDENILYIEGDPTKEQVLELANIEHAKGLVSALSTDSENLLVVLSAREMSSALRIISCVYDRENDHKFKRVGANGTVMASYIGGLRMASEAIRPTVVSFLDSMLRDTGRTLRIEEITVPEEDSIWAEKSLKEIDFPRQTGLLIVAVKSLKSGKYIYNPRGDYVVEADDVLIVIGETEQMLKMKKMLGYVLDEGDSPEKGSPAPSGAASPSP
ncbi:MAG: NAD-binding protein [bacterium]